MKKPLLVSLFALVMLWVISCQKEAPKMPIDYVNPFVGTGGHGHTFPGATAPFGGVQLSPDTRKDSWDGCSGYHYSDSTILGFSHMHLSGTGVGDYGDIRMMPTVGDIQLNPGSAENPDSGYASRFRHETEKASPGYYSVNLDDYDIEVELTASTHAGMHRYHFPKTDKARVVLDLTESVVTETILDAELRILGDHEVMGYRRTKAWANDQIVYFYAYFSRPFQATGLAVDGEYLQNKMEAKANDLKAVFTFNMMDGGPLLIKVGISAVDYHNAQENCLQEIEGWNFEAVHENTRDEWSKQLGKIQVTDDNEEAKSVFYTALYHTMIAPNTYSDVLGSYRNHAGKIVQDRSFTMYTVFSLWDTFRTLHPLFTLIEPKRTNDMVNSMLDMYNNDGLLPVWELAGNETNCMIGYHSVPVIADAWLKGIRGFDAHLALTAMKQSATSGLFGLNEYMAKGYIPADKEGESVSKTLEYAYDDWCIAQMAKGLGDSATYKEFISRAQYYKNLFDKNTGFFRGKSNGGFVEPFDPTQVNFMLTEANTWQYNFFVPQDINTHIQLLGGDEGYEKKLDELFTTTEKLSGRQQSDITGLIGQYAHGNEPSHHMAYLYNYVGKPWKTQKIVRRIMSELYTNKPDGLSGNEDCGQMSAWYVLSSMGFYPVSPGTDKYVLGSPVFDSITVNLENGSKFKIIAENNSDENIYIQSVTYNGQEYPKSFITQKMITNGGELKLIMGQEQNELWGSLPANRPYQKIEDNLITPVPAFSYKTKTFENDIMVDILKFNKDDKVYFKTNNSAYKQFIKPIKINKTTEFKAYSKNGDVESFEEDCKLIKIPAGRNITLNTDYSPQYSAGGNIALINMLRGGNDFKTGDWQGYHGNDIDAVVDLGKEQKISKLGMGFLQDENSWIFMPEYVRFEVSENGKDFEEVGVVKNTVSQKAGGGIIKNFELKLNNARKIKYIKVFAKNIEKCPDWHKGAGGTSWLFADEIWFE